MMGARGVGPQVGALVAGRVEVSGLVRVVPEAALHVAGARLGDARHEFPLLARVVEHLGHHVMEVFHIVAHPGVGFALDLLLHPVVVLLHVHENGAHPGQAGRDQRGRKEDPRRQRRARRGQKPALDVAHRPDLVFQGELLAAVLGRFERLLDVGQRPVDLLRRLVGDPDVVLVLAGIGQDGLLRPQVVADRPVQDLFEHLRQHGFAGAGAAHHQHVPAVLGDLADGHLGPVLEDDALDRVLREVDLGGVVEEPEALRKGARVVQQLADPGVVAVAVVTRHGRPP